MTNYFISDTHFGHKNILHFAGRPWKDIDEMDRDMVAMWNAIVTPDDYVYHLGDFAFKMHPKKMTELIYSLNGVKVLIKGNHDNQTVQQCGCQFRYIHDILDLPGHGVLCHYPLESWKGSNRGNWHIHGHTHGNISDREFRRDIGVDATHIYHPITWNQIVRLPVRAISST